MPKIYVPTNIVEALNAAKSGIIKSEYLSFASDLVARLTNGDKEAYFRKFNMTPEEQACSELKGLYGSHEFTRRAKSVKVFGHEEPAIQDLFRFNGGKGTVLVVDISDNVAMRLRLDLEGFVEQHIPHQVPLKPITDITQMPDPYFTSAKLGKVILINQPEALKEIKTAFSGYVRSVDYRVR